MTMSHKLSEQIRSARKAAGLTQAELAGLCDLDQSYLSLIERDEREPSLSTLRRLAEVLGVSVAFLFGEEKAA